MSKYSAFDAALLAHIRAGGAKAMLLEHKEDLKRLAVPHQTENRWGERKSVYRVVDGRLQNLRKRGLISFNGKTWEAVA